LTFRDLSDVKRTQSFCNIIFQEFQGFSKQSPFIWFYHCEADLLVFPCFWLSGNFQTSNRPNHFATLFFQEIEDREKKKSTENATRQEIGAHVGSHPGRMVGPISPLVRPFNVVLDSTDLSWRKPAIQMTPRAISWWGGRETQNTRN
jgi:hypothetical protein